MKISKELKVLLIVSALFIVFKDKIEYIYFKYIMDPILSEAKSNIVVDLVFTILFIGVIYLFVKKVKHKPNKSISNLVISFIILFFYLYYRLYYTSLFKSFSLIKEVKYFDVIYSYFLLDIIILFIGFLQPRKKAIEISERTLYDDDAIEHIEQDVLNRYYKAKNLYVEISHTVSNRAIAIGITGEWGSGKTSFIKLFKKEIESDKSFITIEFNPWLGVSSESVIKDFFTTLEDSLRKYNFQLSKEIGRYSDIILNIYKTSLTETIANGLNVLKDSNLASEFTKINNLVKASGFRVVIIIDDFDRLLANEIFEILKLIRNTAGFESFIYIVAYDKDYLVKSLDNYNVPKPEFYAEKIFLKEEHLLPASSQQLEGFIKNELRKKLLYNDEQIEKVFNESHILSSKTEKKFFLRHLRDVKRFLNLFINDFKNVAGEVSFIDYYYIKLLKFKYYEIYTLLFLGKDKFLTTDSDSYNAHQKSLVLKMENKPTSSWNIKFEESILGKYIVDEFNFRNDEISEIKLLMQVLFNYQGNYRDDKLSISIPNNYYIYFRDFLDEKAISELEFNKVMKLDFKKISDKILEWKNNNKLGALLYKFYTYDSNDIQIREEYETFIKSIFFLASLEYENYYLRYDFNNLKNNISNYTSSITDKFYKGNVQDFKLFLKSIFDGPHNSYHYVSGFMNHLSKEFSNEGIVFTYEEINEYLLKYFKTYLESINTLNNTVWQLYHNCKVYRWETAEGHYSSKGRYLEEAKSILIDFMKKDLDSFLVSFVKPQDFYKSSKSDTKLGISTGVKDNIFGSYENLIEFLKSDELEKELLKPSYFKQEFLQFAEEFLEKGEMIDFDFSYPPIVEKLEGKDFNT